MRKRVLIADDHELLLGGVVRLLTSDFEVVGTVKDGRSLISAAQQLSPDLVILDIGMPLLNGIEAARQLRSLLPKIVLIFLTQQLSSDYVQAAFRAGAQGYVAKQSASTELLEALRLAVSGGYYVTPLVIAKDQPLFAIRDLKANPADFFGVSLTSRQREVLQLIAEGKSAKEISASLHISVKTVEFHKNGLMDELGMRTTAELTRYALANGIVGA